MASSYEEYFITDNENDLGLEIGEYDNLSELNELAERINNRDTSKLETLKAIIEHESPYIYDTMNILDRLDEYALYTDIHEDSDLGYYYIHEAGGYDLECMRRLPHKFVMSPIFIYFTVIKQ